MRKLLLSNVHYFYYSTETFFKNISALGFTETELYLGTPHIFIDGRVIDDFSNIGYLADKYHVKIKSVRPETLSFRYSLCYLDNLWNSMSLETYKNCIDFAADVVAEAVHTNLTCGFRDLDREQIMDRCIANLRTLVNYCKTKGIELDVESEAEEYQGFITNLKEMKQLLHQEDLYNVGVGLNSVAIAQAGESWEEWFDTFGERIRYFRVSGLTEIHSMNNFSKDIVLFNTAEKWLEEPHVFDSKIVSNIREARRSEWL